MKTIRPLSILVFLLAASIVWSDVSSATVGRTEQSNERSLGSVLAFGVLVADIAVVGSNLSHEGPPSGTRTLTSLIVAAASFALAAHVESGGAGIAYSLGGSLAAISGLAPLMRNRDEHRHVRTTRNRTTEEPRLRLHMGPTGVCLIGSF
jgi:hypothetical protein